MPRAADPTVRAALVDRAAHILATDGPGRLTLRRLTREVGTSTMAVYTHFGSMDQLRIAICVEGFRRLASHLGAVETTDDPVADLLTLGGAYLANARENPNLYRAMFLDRLPGFTPDSTAPTVDATALADLTDLTEEGLANFAMLVDAVRRCVDAGTFVDADPEQLATELWGSVHGVVALELAGMLEPVRSATVLHSLYRHLFIGHGMAAHLVDSSFATVAAFDGAA